MRGTVVILIFVVGFIYVATQVGSMYIAKSNMEDFLAKEVYSVDDNVKDQVRRNVAAKAKELGIPIAADKIDVVYEDADTRLVSQRMVGQRINAEFKNKRAVIRFHYFASIVGFQVPQDISIQAVRQTSATLKTGKALQEALDSP